MRVLVATDAWHPQVNGVVRTLQSVAEAAGALGAELHFITPNDFPGMKMPFYPEIRLAFPRASRLAAMIERVGPDAIHVATEGPIGWAARAYARRRALPFTTSFHTRFPDYLAARLPIPRAASWAWLRHFHNAASNVMVSTPALKAELEGRGFQHVTLWPRGVDTDRFRPREASVLDLPRPIFLSVGRLAVEKNVEAFLSLDLLGSKVVVGDGPARADLERRFPEAIFLGAKEGETLADIYASADVFVFPSLTDTYGLVLLEATASGLPVAAFPAAGPRDAIGDDPAGALDADLHAACLHAQGIPRETARAFAMRFRWEESAKRFLDNVADVRPVLAARSRTRRLLAHGRNAGRAALFGALFFVRRRA